MPIIRAGSRPLQQENASRQMDLSEAKFYEELERLRAGKCTCFVARRPLDRAAVKEVEPADAAGGTKPGDAPDRRQPVVKTIFAGSFNPVHAGHLEMARVAEAMLGTTVWFELSVRNADKDPLSRERIFEISSQDFGSYGLIITSAATFEAKAMLFPQVQFVVGGDTIRRVGQPRFYPDGLNGYQRSLQVLREKGCRFLVFARKFGKIVLEQENLELDQELLKLCRFVPTTRFVMDISSTGIRDQRIEIE